MPSSPASLSTLGFGPNGKRMASVIRNSDENRADRDAGKAKAYKSSPEPESELPDAADVEAGGDPKGGKGSKPAPEAIADRRSDRSYFTIYKKGQGYWTRMGTVIACTVLGLMLAYTLYDKIPAFFVESRTSTVDVKTPTSAAEATSLIDQAKKDVEAGRIMDARVRLDRVTGARNTNAVPAEIIAQAQTARNAVPEPASKGRRIGLIAALAFLALYVPLVYHFVNKASNVDFLIATDSEMKKVNWTSRRELIGSTKVVIVFMFFIAFLLFVIDILFGYLMHWIGVLIHSPYITIGGG